MKSPEGPEALARLQALEERLSFQQRVLDELNEAVLNQDRRLVQLDRELARLRTHVQRLAELSPGEDLPHEKPPHY